MLAFGRYGVYDDGGANDDSDAVMCILLIFLTVPLHMGAFSVQEVSFLLISQ